MVKRDEKGRFLDSGNPQGRPKKDKELQEAIQNALEDSELLERLLEKLKLTDDPRDLIQGLKLLWDRGYGKAPETLKHEVEKGIARFSLEFTEESDE